MGSRLHVSKWGDDLVVKIPQEVAEELGIFEGRPVELDPGEPLKMRKSHYKPEELLEGITPENYHPEVDWGHPVGKEVW